MTLAATLQRLALLLLGLAPSALFAAFAALVLRAHPEQGIAILKLPIYALCAVLTAHLILLGPRLSAVGAVAGPIVVVVAVMGEGHDLAVSRFCAALLVCGCVYLMLFFSDTLSEAIVGGLIGLIIGGFTARFCMGLDAGMASIFGLLFMVLLVAARWNSRPATEDADNPRKSSLE